MQELLDVNWLVVITGGVVAYILGAVWYSPLMFAAVWKRGIGTAAVSGRPMLPIMLVQLVATLLFAWAVVAALEISLALAVLVAFATSGILKADGLFAGKAIGAIAVETSYVLAQAAIVILTAQILG